MYDSARPNVTDDVIYDMTTYVKVAQPVEGKMDREKSL